MKKNRVQSIVIFYILLFIFSFTIQCSESHHYYKVSIKNKITLDEGLQNSSWPMFQHDNQHTGRSPYGQMGSKPVVKWQFWMDGMTISSPSIDENGTIYIGANDLHDSFFAINQNGTEKWRYDTSDWVLSSPAIVSDGTIYFGCNDGGLYALYPNGTRKWRSGLGTGWVYSSPALDDNGIVYAASLGSSRLCAVYPNGTIKWDFFADDWIYCSPSLDKLGTIYIGSNDGKMYSVYPNGTQYWAFPTGAEIGSDAAIGEDNTIYFGSNDYYLYALYPNGTLKWKYHTGAEVVNSPSISLDGTIYVGSYNGKIFAIRSNGTKKWEYETNGPILSSPAIDTYGTIYVGSWDGNLYALNPDGTLKWKFLAGDSIESSPAIDENGTIYIAGQFHSKGKRSSYTYLYALDVEGFCADAGGPYFGLVGEEIAFTGEVSGGVPPYSWHWDFGDGNTSELQNPTHVYTSPNEYTVVLTVTDSEENVTNDTTWAYITTQTELDIDISKEGITIKNRGNTIAYDVEWTVDITGGFLGLINKHLDGSEEELAVGEEITINMPFLLGLGPLTISATAEAFNAVSIVEAKDGFILLFFVALP